MGSVVITWGPFEVELAARPITILSPCFAMDKVKTDWKILAEFETERNKWYYQILGRRSVACMRVLKFLREFWNIMKFIEPEN